MMGVALASSAFRHALAYAKDRIQGSQIMQKDPTVAVPIIQHTDVHRMLLKQKSIVEGIRMLCLYCCFTMDLRRVSTNEVETEKRQGMIGVLTPIVKSYCTEMGLMVNDLAVQTYGVYGYCREYPVEPHVRSENQYDL